MLYVNVWNSSSKSHPQSHCYDCVRIPGEPLFIGTYRAVGSLTKKFFLLLQHFPVLNGIQGRGEGVISKPRENLRNPMPEKEELMMKKNLFTAVVTSALIGSALYAVPAAAAPETSLFQTMNASEEPEEAEEKDVATVSVSAESSVKIEPDMAEIAFSVDTTNADAAEAEKENSEKTDAVQAALSALGIDGMEVSTSDYSMSPVYDYNNTDEEGNPALTGYEVTTTLSVTGIGVDDAGKVISEGVKAGINNVQYVNFLSSNYDEAYDQALAQAMKDCRRKADVIAEAAGLKVIRATWIDEGYQDTSAKYETRSYAANEVMEAYDASSADSSRTLTPGQLEITASVSVEYSLADSSAED